MSVFAKASASRKRRGIWAGVAITATSALLLSACASGEQPAESESQGPREDQTLKIGTVLPQTGALSFLGPPEEAGVGLAVQDINEADLGVTVEVEWGDSGDPDNKAYETTVPRLLSADVNALVGAAASGVTKLFLDQAVGAGVLTFSPANTSPDFTDWDDDNLYWRTAPSDLLQGEVLGNQIAEDGVSNLGIIYLNDAYGTGLAKSLTENFEGTGGTVVASESYNAGDTSFDAQASTVLAAKPDAVAVIGFEETSTIVPTFVSAGFDGSKFYFVDGNLKQWGGDMPVSIAGSKGTTPGPKLSDDFQQRLKDYWKAENGSELEDFTYAAEAYDAVVLLALAALAANSTEGADLAAQLQEVSGGSGDGEKVDNFADAAKLILDGKKVDYDGYSGPITFDENGDPTEAAIGVYEFGDDNLHTRIND
ncbi:ABC transporter substrate-binding protein [Agromyces archimandritae]|uniref:ABC transporter substrate-binding protein n=1 Tax=Agromyces archimandritae TaxID=2781962 RepID=A0A975FMZ4_9MICO|nr:ABC transporter substrate-binding protein [Agromyces archimandritae]QTX05448.1 ABC transporter substrate-binding protein [Agromyces archimandritae]